MRVPLLRHYALWVRQPLDLEAMDEAAQVLVGSHDFGTFGTAPRATRRKRRGMGNTQARVRSEQPSTVRRVVRAVWSRAGEKYPAPQVPGWQKMLLEGMTADTSTGEAHSSLPAVRAVSWQGLVEFTIEANAFLYHMVRSIVGTLLQVGLGDRSVSEFASALYGADRALAGPTAAPHGLCLIGVKYEENQ